MVSFFYLTYVATAIGLFFLTVVAAAIGLFTLQRKLRFHQDSNENNSSSPPIPQSPLSRNWDHNVFPSFHGPDVRNTFLSHMLKEFRSKGIEPFIDNNIERSKSIGHELERAIRGSKIAIVLLSNNYASSSWCLDELVEIMKCKNRGQTVMTIFYEVDPTDVKKQTGDFGKAFKKTCQGKSNKKGETWKKALEDVATIAGYHSKNFDNEAAMIEEISANVSKLLNHFTPSCDFERYIGMGAHIEKTKSLLRMDSDEVRMIGIWGPPGIGKTTIARYIFNQLSNSFQLNANMVKIKECYARPCLDEYDAQLQLQNHMLSQVLNQKDMVISHLGVAQERLKEKKVLLVLDDVDRVAQLDALAEDIRWFGPGSRIIIVTEDVRVLRAHGINHIYTVDLPSDDEALQMFCMYAFGQKYPKDGFRELAWEIVCHAGKLPLGLKVMGSYFRRMSKQDWKKALPKLWSNLDGEIESILKFSYDALDYVQKNLFLHIACFFVNERTERVKEYLVKTFPNVSHELDVLADKSLIYNDRLSMHDLLIKFGRQIVREQSMDPRQREFLIDNEEISEILEDDGAGSEKVIGIKFDSNRNELNISERAFEGMSNLQFLKIEGGDSLHLPHGLSYLSSKLRLLHWNHFPATCLPSNVNMKFLVELNMMWSKFEKLWEGVKRLPNLKWMYLNESENLKELPDLSTATNLQELDLRGCSSLVKLSCIGNATNLQILKLEECSSLVELHSSIGNAINLKELDFQRCSSLVELPDSIGNLHQLKRLIMKGCSKLEVLPVNVNLKSLEFFDLCGCSSLKRFPEISTKISYLNLSGTAIEEVPSSIRSWSLLQCLIMYDCKNLKELPHALDSITESDTKIQEVQGCKELFSLPHLPESLHELDCSKLEVLPVNLNLKSFDWFDLSNCSSLKRFPEISTNIRSLILSGTAIEEVPSSIRSWSRLNQLYMSGCKKLKKFAPALDSITECDTKIQEVSPLVQGFPRLSRLVLKGCKELLSLSQLPDSLELLDAGNCESLERLEYCSFRNPNIRLNFANCFKLNKEARDLIIQTSSCHVSVLPGEEIPTYFTYRANGSSLMVKLHERPLPCVLLIKKNGNGIDASAAEMEKVEYWIKVKQDSVLCLCKGDSSLPLPLTTDHLYIFEYEADVTSNELSFEFSVIYSIGSSKERNESVEWAIKECGCRPEKEFKEE